MDRVRGGGVGLGGQVRMLNEEKRTLLGAVKEAGNYLHKAFACKLTRVLPKAQQLCTPPN